MKMSVKINDRILVYVLFATLAVLSFFTVTGNRAAREAATDASRSARSAVIKAEEAVKATTEARDIIFDKEVNDALQVNSHRIRNEAEHECFLSILSSGGTDLITRFKTCVIAQTPGTIDPKPAPGQEE